MFEARVAVATARGTSAGFSRLVARVGGWGMAAGTDDAEAAAAAYVVAAAAEGASAWRARGATALYAGIARDCAGGRGGAVEGLGNRDGRGRRI